MVIYRNLPTVSRKAGAPAREKSRRNAAPGQRGIAGRRIRFPELEFQERLHSKISPIGSRAAVASRLLDAISVRGLGRMREELGAEIPRGALRPATLAFGAMRP
jgi:hypothetical protein